MSVKSFEFYIDESGDFNDEAANERWYQNNPSLVGGILYESNALSEAQIRILLPERVHCMKKYEPYYLDALEKLRAKGHRLIIFQNKERLNVVNGDLTYLNIITEGLVQLLSNLVLEYPDDQVKTRVVIATRKNNERGYGILSESEYLQRLEEKLYIASHRSKARICDYEISFADARYSKRHDVADIVCNTYLTRSGKKKFTDEDRERIDRIYDPADIYSVFEDVTVSNLKQLLSEGRYSEMMYQLCILPNLQGVLRLRDLLLSKVARSKGAERKAYFDYMSLQIGLYNDRRMYRDGIRFAGNYKKYILEPLAEKYDLPKQETDYRTLDTDFYILTMYDHMGNAVKCVEYIDRCNQNIDSVNHSWEHIAYYFTYRLREMNTLIGLYDFETVVEKADKLIDIFSGAKELFGMIETYDGTARPLQSELLGKAYGIQLQAYINLIESRPELLEKALEVSDKAISEFSAADDLKRQYMYRCQLLLTANRPAEAWECLARSYQIGDSSKDPFAAFIAAAYDGRDTSDAFAMNHYTNVMASFGKAGDPRGAAMYQALSASAAFMDDLKNPRTGGYPWNLVFWNISRWYQSAGSPSGVEEYYKRALANSREFTDQVILYAFSLSIMADYLKWALREGRVTLQRAKQEFTRCLNSFDKLAVPDSMKKHFARCDSDDFGQMLERYSRASLKQ